MAHDYHQPSRRSWADRETLVPSTREQRGVGLLRDARPRRPGAAQDRPLSDAATRLLSELPESAESLTPGQLQRWAHLRQRTAVAQGEFAARLGATADRAVQHGASIDTQIWDALTATQRANLARSVTRKRDADQASLALASWEQCSRLSATIKHASQDPPESTSGTHSRHEHE